MVGSSARQIFCGFESQRSATAEDTHEQQPTGHQEITNEEDGYDAAFNKRR